MAQIAEQVHAMLQRHYAFWQCGAADQPLIGITRWPYIPIQAFDWGLNFDQGILDPKMLAIDHFMPQYEEVYSTKGLLDGDLFWIAQPPGAVPWMEAIVGCPVHFSKTSGNMFTQPVIYDLNRVSQLGQLSDNVWFQKLIEFAKGLVKLSQGRFPVAVPITRGPWDMVAALRGMTNLYLDLHDHPRELRRLAEACANVWIQVTRELSKIIPPWQGGFVGIFGQWGSLFNPSPQNDVSVSVSPKTYREGMLPIDQKTVQAWPSCLFHLHSAGYRHIDALLDILEGRALEVNLDPSGPPLEKLLPVFRKVQDRHVPLLVLCNQWNQVEELISGLSPQGLAVYHAPVTAPLSLD